MLNFYNKGINFLLAKDLSSISQSLLHKETVILFGLRVTFLNKLLP